MSSASEPLKLDLPIDGRIEPVQIRGLTPAEWSRLVDEHPARAGADPGPPYDVASFLPALLRACLIDPAVDLDLAEELLDDEAAGPVLARACLEESAPRSWQWALARIDSDPRLALELDVCGELGIGHDEFLGWPERSQELALAWLHRRRDVCPGCGVPSRDMGSWSAWQVRQRECASCRAIQGAQDGVPEAHRRSVHVDLIRPRPDDEQDDDEPVGGGD